LAYWLSNIDELRCLFSSLDALLRKEARGIKSGPGAPKSLTKLLNDIHFLETELVGQFLKKAKESIEKMVVTAVLENSSLFFSSFFLFFACSCRICAGPMKSLSHGPHYTPQIFLIFIGEMAQTLREFYVDDDITKHGLFASLCLCVYGSDLLHLLCGCPCVCVCFVPFQCLATSFTSLGRTPSITCY